MWCAQTRKPMTAMAMLEPAMKEYPKMGLPRESGNNFADHAHGQEES